MTGLPIYYHVTFTATKVTCFHHMVKHLLTVGKKCLLVFNQDV